MQNNDPLIAIVDDDEGVREAIKGLLRSMKLAAGAFPSAEDFLRSPDINRTICLIADINMPGMSGFDLHRHIAHHGLNIPMILITAYANDAVQALTLEPGVFGYLVKPFSDDDLFKCISIACSSALDRRQAP